MVSLMYRVYYSLVRCVSK